MTRSSCSQRSSGYSSIGAMNWRPALLIRMSTLPCCATVSATTCRQLSRSATSSPKAIAAGIVAATRSAADRSRSARTTRAPDSASLPAMAEPMAPPPPVTIATRPWSSGISGPAPCVAGPLIVTSPLGARSSRRVDTIMPRRSRSRNPLGAHCGRARLEGGQDAEAGAPRRRREGEPDPLARRRGQRLRVRRGNGRRRPGDGNREGGRLRGRMPPDARQRRPAASRRRARL